MFVKNVLFICRLVLVFSIGNIYALFFGKEHSFNYIIKQLASTNIFFLKMFQSLSINSKLLTKQQNDYLIQYTDSVPYNNNDINHDFINDIIDISKDKKVNIDLSKPIQSGAIALIYKGTIGDKNIVVKVKKKNIKSKIEEGINYMYVLGYIIENLALIPALDPIILIDENKDIMLKQTDFINEVNNLKRMKKDCLNIDYIKIPEVYPEYTHKNNNIIIMDYIDGKHLKDLKNEEKDDYALLLAKFGIKSFLFNKFYHSDLHIGNILFLDKQLGILDFGIMGELTNSEQTIFFEFITNIGSKNKDMNKIIDIIINNLIEQRNKNKNIIDTNTLKTDIKQELVDVFSYRLEKTGNINSDDLYEINKILYKYNLRLSRSFCKVVLAFTISDCVCQEIAYNIPYLKHFENAVNELFDVNFLSY